MPVPEKKPFQRLSKDVVPVHYNLRLRPFLKTFKFDGSETIEVRVDNPTKEVRLNCADIVIREASFKCPSDVTGDDLKAGDGMRPKEIKYVEEEEVVVLCFDSPLPLGKGSLHIAFEGTLNDQMKGFYRSTYKTPSGEEHVLACTQLEATDARRAFPCWDEPACKATFDVTLVVPKDRVALSNMPAEECIEPSWLSLLCDRMGQPPCQASYG